MNIDDLLKLLGEAPDSQLDKTVADEMKNLIGKPAAEQKIGVMRAIDNCVRYSLASTFTMMVLNDIFYVGLEGKPEDFNDENCPWRKNN